MKEIKRDLEKFAAEKFDLIIVGGGIYGIMLLLEAVRRGLKPLLLEKEDFCGKTSHNHLRTVHGGLRYLQSLDLFRFRDSIKERRWFLKYFPEFTGVLPCLMPLYNKGIYRKSVFRIGLPVNDILSFDRNFSVSREKHLPGGKVLSKEKTIELFPSVDTNELKGGMVWYDGCLTEFQGFYIAALKLAVQMGAKALNYVEAVGLIRQNDEVSGVKGKDRESGKEFAFNAPVVINACGPWSRDTAGIFEKDYPRLFKKRKLLWNVLFDREALSSHALGLRSKAGLVYVCHPWKGRLLVGSPEKLVEKSEAETVAPFQKMEEFIRDINEIVSGLGLEYKDILRVYPGVLPAEPDGSFSGRPAFIDHHKNGGVKGLYSISGVKFTTARLESDRVLGRIFRHKKAISYDEMLSKKEICCHSMAYDWQPNGEDDLEILKKIIKEESVVHLSDLILRRTSLGDNPPRALAILAKIRSLFDWDNKKWDEEVDLLRKQLREGFPNQKPRGAGNR